MVARELRERLAARLFPARPPPEGTAESRSAESRSAEGEDRGRSRPGERDAAVVLLFRPARGDGPGGRAAVAEALFVRRAEREGDPWSGQVGLPGGHREPVDRDLLGTARRELEEETSLHLPEDAFLGRLPAIRPRSRRLPPVTVTPFVAWGRPEVRIRESEELTGHFWVSLPELAGEACRSVLTFRRGPALRAFPTIEVPDGTIWGLTLVIVRRALSLLDPGPNGARAGRRSADAAPDAGVDAARRSGSGAGPRDPGRARGEWTW